MSDETKTDDTIVDPAAPEGAGVDSPASDDTTSAKTTEVQADAGKTDEQANVTEADPDTEVAARSADVDEVETEVHRKEFVHGPGVYTVAAGFSHEANYAAVRQYLINQGLRPVGDVRHVSTKTHADGVSKVLAYEVEAVPAHLAEAYEVAHAEVIQGEGGEAPATTASE